MKKYKIIIGLLGMVSLYGTTIFSHSSSASNIVPSDLYLPSVDIPNKYEFMYLVMKHTGYIRTNINIFNGAHIRYQYTDIAKNRFYSLVNYGGENLNNHTSNKKMDLWTDYRFYKPLLFIIDGINKDKSLELYLLMLPFGDVSYGTPSFKHFEIFYCIHSNTSVPCAGTQVWKHPLPRLYPNPTSPVDYGCNFYIMENTTTDPSFDNLEFKFNDLQKNLSYSFVLN